MIWLLLILFILYIVVVYMIIRAFYLLNQETDWKIEDKEDKNK